MKAIWIPARGALVLLLGWGVLLGGGAPGSSAWGQTSSGQEQQLREELEKAQREIERLKQENERLKAAPGAPLSVPASAAPAAPGSERPAAVSVPAVPPASGLPAAAAASGVAGAPAPSMVMVPAPIAEGETVSTARLLADYTQSALAGDARYKGRRFRVEGTVKSFKKVFATLGWDVHLEGGDTLGLVRCRVSFPGISDFRGEGGAILEGRRPFREWNPLLSKGGKVVLEGTCHGSDDGTIVFKDCRPVSP